MGIGGRFWDLLKPYARTEGPDFLREKRVAIDLSFWIVQHDTAIRARRPFARSPHIRTTFFRTIALFSKMGAHPVFVVDGEPSPLKTQSRMERFFRCSGIDLAELPKNEPGSPVKQRNQHFAKCIRDCVELLELLGMPILRANGEAEALCAQLNYEGHVDACITADSDAFLFGAKCVIKCFRSNSSDPYECYNISDVEAGLGLRRKQLVAIALLVGNDHDLNGVPGFGVDTAVRFVQMFNEDEILDRLHEVGKGVIPVVAGSVSSAIHLDEPNVNDALTKAKSPHCSQCGHPGSKKAHSTSSCEHCINNGFENCMVKPAGFKCECSSCEKDRKSKERRKYENWQIRVCKMIAAEDNFPNSEIIAIYLRNKNGSYDEGPSLRWDYPKVEHLVDFLTFNMQWEPSYIRQRMLPMLSTIYLREMASTQNRDMLLYDQYEFHSIQRVKIRYGHRYYLVKWKRTTNSVGYVNYATQSEHTEFKAEALGATESTDLSDEPDVPRILIDDGCWFLLTDENIGLVQAAFPDKVDKFTQEKELKGSPSKQRKSNSRSGKSKTGAGDESPKSTHVQLSITEFYRSTKVTFQAKPVEEDPGSNSQNAGPVTERRKISAAGLDNSTSKSAKRRLVFG
ncbi:putative spleen exonuclease [Dioscorea sansibarensis]